MQSFNMGRVPPVAFGAGLTAKVPRIVNDLGGGPVLIVADSVLADLGLTTRLTEALRAEGVPFELAADVAGEPKIALVDALRARARESGAEVVIGLGGGAAMDAAKTVATLARSDLPSVDFALAALSLPKDGVPSIAIPTTAGTGSEVTRTAVISDAEGAKIWFWGEELMFAQAVLDPEWTVSLPPHLTAWTGMDAVAHALEGMTSRNSNAAGRLYGREALTILRMALPGVVADGTDIEGRGRVLWASMIAGLALHNCNTHMGHNISHALGSLVRVHHGLATALGLETSLPWLVQRPEGADAYAEAAAALGGPARPDALPDAFAALMRACQIPSALPAECADVAPAALAAKMKAPANIGMAENAACPVSEADLDEMAGLMLRLPVAAAAA